MTETREMHVADLHMKAAYAHTAAAFSHSTGDHSSAQQLAMTALGDSMEAVKFTEEIAQDSQQSSSA